MALDIAQFWEVAGGELLIGLGIAFVSGISAYRLGQRRRDPTPTPRASAAIAASGSVAIVWPDDDDGQGWGLPEEEANRETRQILVQKLGLAGKTDAEPVTTFDILDGLKAASPEFVECLSRLRTRGESFSLFVHGLDAMGKPFGAKAILWLTPGVAAGDFAGTMGAGFPAWRTDSQGALLWANDAYLEAVEATDLDDARARDLALDPKARDDARLAVSGQSCVDTRAITIGGKRRTLRIKLFPAADGAAGIGVDLSDEVESRDALLREAKAYVETLNHLTDAVAVFDSSRRLITHNSAFGALWALEDAWLNDRPSHSEWLDRLRQSARIAAARDFAAWKAKELSYYQEAGLIPDETWTLPDGRILRVARQRQPSGGLLILFEDISDKMGLQARYKTLIDVQRATLDRLGEAVAVFSADGRLSLANASFAKMWDIDTAFLEAMPEFDLLVGQAKRVYGDPTFWSDLKARISDPSPQARQEMQGEFVCANNTSLAWLTKPLPDGATLAAFADTTAAKSVQTALQDRAAAFEDADRLKTEFVRNVSYQLRTPLTTISGYTELLNTGVSGPLTPAQGDYLGAIGTAASQLEKLVENMLTLALINSGKLTLDLGDVNLADALEVTAELARTNSGDKQVRVVVECDENVGIIRADNGCIRQILFNLVSNALRVTENGDTITLGARRIEDSVRIWVSDTGPSIEAKNQASAFEGFRDGERRAGVSLSLVKRFVELHGGWVAMTSAGTRGVTVSCFLPARAAQEYAEPELDLVG